MENELDQKIYFIGIALPENLTRQLSEIQWSLHSKNPHSLKPIVPHITLLHPPSLKGILPNDLLPKIRQIAAKYVPLTIALTEISFFKDSVCYVTVQSQALYSLQMQLVKLLPPDVQSTHYKRSYIPHITLAQTYDPHTLNTEAIRTYLSKTLPLPQQYAINATSYFTRIMPRVYTTDTISE